VLEQLGFDPTETLAELGFDIGLLADPDTVIPYATRTLLLQQCAEKTGCQHFGHLVGRAAGPSSYGIAGFLIQQSADVGSALRSFVRFSHLHVNGAVIYLEEQQKAAFLGYSILDSEGIASEQLSDAAATAGYNILKSICGEDWRPTEVCFAHRRPRNIRPFNQYFSAPLVFDEGRTGVEFSTDWLSKPVIGANPRLHDFLAKQVKQLEIKHGEDFAAQVRHVLRSAVLTHQATASQVAALFSLHERTLNRRLTDLGTSFRNLLNETRFEIAQQLLAESSMTLTEIAATLDYSDTSSFARAFRRQGGMSPTEWRRESQNKN
jgi:AraC-like DNA-binding protein